MNLGLFVNRLLKLGYFRNNGNTIPAVALGTWQSSEEEDVVYKAVKAAIAAGYRHIDTAMMV